MHTKHPCDNIPSTCFPLKVSRTRNRSKKNPFVSAKSSAFWLCIRQDIRNRWNAVFRYNYRLGFIVLCGLRGYKYSH